MKLIGWAIALAAAWLTPAAAQAPASSPAQPACRRRASASRDARRPRRRAQSPAQPDCRRQPRRCRGSAPATSLPTPGIGQPDGRMGLQDQVTPIGEEAASFHNNWLLPLCAIISVFVLVLLLWAMVRYRRGANPMPSRNSHNTDDRGDLDAGPGADPGRDRDPVDPAARATHTRRRRPT